MKNKLPGINDNASRKELDEMVEDMINNGPIDLCKSSISQKETNKSHLFDGIPIINDNPTPKELDAMYRNLMKQKDDM